MAKRVVYRRRHSYNTRSNKIKKVKTPGMRLVVQYLGKHSKGVMAPHDSCDCGKRIIGLPKLNAKEFRGLPRSQKRISRAYGGNLCAGCVKDRILRAYMLQQLVKGKKSK